MKMGLKSQGYIKLVILLVSIIFGGYFLYPNLVPRVKVAHAASKQAQLSVPAQFKIYLGSAPIRVTFENSTWTANQNEVRSWLTRTTDSISVDSSKFVNMIADQVNIAPTDDRDGRAVDTNNLTNQIKDTLALGRPNRTIALVTSAIPRGSQAGRYSGRYIDVNLSTQTLSAFEGYNLVNQFLVSTGRRGYETPTGEFHVYGKDRSAKMSGPGYYLPKVPYISWWNGDYSIHGTYWHHNFGHVMSHGCINMAISDAEWIYNWDDIGTPVHVHY